MMSLTYEKVAHSGEQHNIQNVSFFDISTKHYKYDDDVILTAHYLDNGKPKILEIHNIAFFHYNGIREEQSYDK